MGEQWEVKGKTFIITGGASGLGALYAEAFLKEGAKKIAILDIAEDLGNATVSRLNNTYTDSAKFIQCDVSKEENIAEAFNSVVNEFGKIDVIINNAGLMVDSPNMWRISCDVNWQGLVSFTMKGLSHMRKDEGGAGGTIINISSTAAITRFRQLPIYSGSKMAVLHFGQSLSVPPFFEQTGVRILTVCPGPTDTALMQGLVQRGYDATICNELDMIGQQFHQNYQKPSSAVEAVVQVYKEGANGSTWMSVNDKPVKDVTAIIAEMFEKFENMML